MSRDYVLSKKLYPGAIYDEVKVNGKSVDFIQENNLLSLRTRLDAGETADIQLCRKGPAVPGIGDVRKRSTTKVLIRRRLCEWRDNYVMRSPFLSRITRVALTWRSRQ